MYCMDRTLIIAEAGANHNQDFNTAKKLIDSAKNAGSDICKFQTYTANKLFSSKATTVNGYSEIQKIFSKMELDRSWQKDLKLYCEDQGIEFMSTPFDESAVDELYNLGVKRFKISGFESTDLRFIKYVASTKKPLIISAGLGTDIKFISEILSVCREVKNNDITILHCNNAYPTPEEDTNLLTIPEIKNKYNIKVGFSDHTLGIIAPVVAVSLGASVIEKHFTLSKKQPGLDHFFALEPDELKEMIKKIKETESMLKLKRGISASELNNIQGQRSIVAKTNIKKGQKLSIKNITTKRPYYNGAVHAKDYFNIIDNNYVMSNDINQDDFILWKQIKN